MSLATLKQGVKFLDMIVEKGVPTERLQWAFESGAISDILDANPSDFDRDAFRKSLGLKPLNPPMSIAVDCDANPKIPSGLYLTGEGTEHRKMGKITLEKRDDGKLYANGKEVVRHLSSNQRNGKVIQGHKLRKELRDVQVLNACILDALLANPRLIPEEWKKGATYFWGTTFRDAVGDLLCVECLCWSGVRWGWDYGWLFIDLNAYELAASLAS